MGFEEVYGNIGSHTYGNAEYDLTHQEVSEYEGSPDSGVPGAKSDQIRMLMQREGIVASEALFVEDDPAELEATAGLLPGIHVAARCGMTDSEMKEICDRVN